MCIRDRVSTRLTCSQLILVEVLYLLSKVDELRSIDNYCVVVKRFPEFCKEDVSARMRLQEDCSPNKLHCLFSGLCVAKVRTAPI